MQILDQHVAAARPAFEQEFDFFGCLRVDLAALGRRLGTPPALAGMLERDDLFRSVVAHLKRL
jgi:hypothetical protein